MKNELQTTPSPIQIMTWQEAIRLRPGMYIGSIDTRGFLQLLKGILQHLMSQQPSSNISVEIKGTQSICLKISAISQPPIDNWSVFNLSPKNPFSVGLETLNALSAVFSVKLFDADSNLLLQEIFEAGNPLKETSNTRLFHCSEMEVEATLDATIWDPSFALNPIFILDEIKSFAYLNKRASFEVIYMEQNKTCRVLYHFEQGLQDRLRLEQIKGLGQALFETSIEHQFENFQIEIAFAFREYSVDEPILKSYVNHYYTHENGTHVDALLKGLTYGVMKYFQQQQVTHYRISEKGIKENLVAFIHLQLDAPTFVGCVKNKLANPEILEPISHLVAEVLFQKMEADSEATQQLIRKFEI